MKNITDVTGRPLEVGQNVIYNQSGAIAVGRITRISVRGLTGKGYGRRGASVIIEKTLGGTQPRLRSGKVPSESTVQNLDGIMILPLP